MPRDEMTGQRVVFPIRNPKKRALAARRAAGVRVAVRKKFPNDERYFQAFRDTRLGDIAASFEGRQVSGVLLIQHRDRDVYEVDERSFRSLYGPLKGRWLFWRYVLEHRFARAGDFYLASIWVRNRARNTGVGSQLLQAATSRLGGRWTVLARSEEAEKFFARHGFRRRSDFHAILLGLATGRRPMEWDGGAVKKIRERPARRSRSPD